MKIPSLQEVLKEGQVVVPDVFDGISIVEQVF